MSKGLPWSSLTGPACSQHCKDSGRGGIWKVGSLIVRPCNEDRTISSVSLEVRWKSHTPDALIGHTWGLRRNSIQGAMHGLEFPTAPTSSPEPPKKSVNVGVTVQKLSKVASVVAPFQGLS